MKYKFLRSVLLAILFGHTTFAQNTFSYTETERFYNQGVELFEKKLYVAARSSFQEYIDKSIKSLSPNEFNLANASYYAAVSGLYINALDADIYVERFVTTYAEHPKAKIIYSDLGSSFYGKGEFDKAIEYFQKATAYRQNTLDVYEDKYKLAVAYYKTDRIDEALRTFNEVKKSISERAIHAAYYAAAINFSRDDYEEALIDLKRVENVSPYKIEVPNWIAQIYFKQNRYDELLAYAEPIVANPNGRKIDEVCLVAAEVLFFQDEFTRAATYYEKYRTFRRGTTDAAVTFRHGYSLYKAEDFARATEFFKEIAYQKGELGQQAAYYLGISALKSKNLDAAEAAFKVAQSNDFDGGITEEATYNYTKVLVEKCNTNEAIEQLKKYVKTYPQGKYTDQTNELLSDILFENNNYKAAIEYIESLPRRTSKINEAYQKLAYNQGVIDFNIEKFKESFSYFQKSLTQQISKPLAEESKFWLAESAFALEDPQAEQLYRNVLSSSNQVLRNKSLYGLGYLYYNKEDYAKAQQFFGEFVDNTKGQEQTIQKYEDALMRLGDSYLVQRNFKQALAVYEDAIQNSRTEKDYALYQKANALKFLGRIAEANRTYKILTSRYKNSRLIDDALYQQGKLELEGGDFNDAISTFTELLRRRPSSILVPSVLVRRALAFSNLQRYDQAINDYKVIVRKFGKSDETEEALIGLRDLLNTVNRNEEFVAIAEEYRKNNPESTSIINLQYETAKGLYFNEKYQQAISALKRYVDLYPSSSNVPEARYYIADAYYILKDYTRALPYYEQVVSDNQTLFASQAAYRAATILFETKKFDDSKKYYVLVAESSSNKRQIALAWEGLIKANFETGNCDEVRKYTNEVLNNGGNIVIGLENRAQLYLGKCLQKNRNWIAAREAYEKTMKLVKDENAAEAQYRIGEMLYNQGDFDGSIIEMQNLSQNYGDFIEWYEKAFLLISKNYISKKDVFMAKATLNSIIENSESAETVSEAKQLLNSIK
jgi:tetratricopeptide (TPR) repeat protein